MSPFLLRSVAAVVLVTVAVVFWTLSLRDGASPYAAIPVADWRYYPVQLHLHGSLSEGTATMRGHNDMARRLGTVDGLWWTDHDWRIAGHGVLPGFRFEAQKETYLVPSRAEIPLNRELLKEVDVYWIPKVDDGIAAHQESHSHEVVAEGEHALEIEARAHPDRAEWQWSGVVLKETRGRLRIPLAADVEVEVRVRPVTPYTETSRTAVRLELSRQPEGRASLLYLLNAPGKPHTLRSKGRLLGIVPVSAPPGRWSRLVLSPTRDAVELGIGGWDNSLYKIHFGVQVRHGATGRLYVDELRLRRLRSGTEVLARAEQMAAGISEEFGFFNHVGLEISYGAHMNVYLPRIEMTDFERYPLGMPPADIVAWAHERGGLASYNHVFGTSRGQVDEYEERSRYLLDNRAFGADLLEVGYPHRVFPLHRHLRTWDLLSRQQVAITAIGTSDSHRLRNGWRGGNNYVSWVWAAGSGRRQLIAGLKSGKVFFGDPVSFRGELHLETAAGVAMGRTIRTTKPYHDVVLRLTELPEGSTVRWIENGKTVAELTPPAGDFVSTFRVVTQHRYRFVRVELWRGKRGLAFSNCLYFEPSDGGGGDG